MRNFKRFLKVLVCVLVVCAVLVFLDLALYPCTFMRNDVHTVTTQQKDVLILGTSNGKMDLDPDLMLAGTGLTGHNLCVGGEYPVDAFYLTKLAIEKQDPKVVIFELDPGYLTTEKEKGNNYLLFYHEFPLSKAKVSYFMDTMLDCDFRAWFFPQYEYPLSYELGKLKETLHQKLTGDYDVSYLKGSVQEYHENGFIEKYPVAEKDFPRLDPEVFSKAEVKETNMDYLDRLVSLCKENDIQLLATTMPLPQRTLHEYADNYNEAWDYFAEFFESHEVPYYNFNREFYKAYSHKAEHYVDWDGHMNGDSAREFSGIFGKIVFHDWIKE